MSSPDPEPPEGSAGERRNFLVYAGSHGLTKLGDALMNPKTTLSWLGAALGAPTFLVAMLVPIREAGSLLLQVMVAGWVERARRRKWVWVAGSLTQGACVAGMGGVAFWLEGSSAGLALLALVGLFALARSLCSLSSKDVLGRTLRKGLRGRAGGWASSAAGAATLLVAGGGLWLGGDEERRSIAWLLLGAAAAWGIAAACFSAMAEPADEAQPGAQSRGRLALLREDPRLRFFILTRSLLLCSALSAPYYVLLAQRHLGEAAGQGWLAFVFLSGLAGLLGGPLWGRMADHSSRQVLGWAAATASALGMLVFYLETWEPQVLDMFWVLPAAYLLLSLAHEGVRIGRKTWIVNIAEGAQRRDYVAVSNSAMGVILLIVGAASAALADWSLSAVLLGLTLLGVAGTIMTRQLPEAEEQT